MYRIIKSGDGEGAIDFDDCFDVSKLIPELDEDRNDRTHMCSPRLILTTDVLAMRLSTMEVHAEHMIVRTAHGSDR